MTTYEPGDIVLVPFPFTDQSGTKQRPGVVLSSATHNRNHADVILAPITSQVGHLPDEANLQDWRTGGLLKPSVVKPLLASFEVTRAKL
jgi:mRNA interferase MazF